MLTLNCIFSNLTSQCWISPTSQKHP